MNWIIGFITVCMDVYIYSRKQFEVLHILRNFPDCDKEALKEKYPEVNVDRAVARLANRNYENIIGMTVEELSRTTLRI